MFHIFFFSLWWMSIFSPWSSGWRSTRTDHSLPEQTVAWIFLTRWFIGPRHNHLKGDRRPKSVNIISYSTLIYLYRILVPLLLLYLNIFKYSFEHLLCCCVFCCVFSYALACSSMLYISFHNCMSAPHDSVNIVEAEVPKFLVSKGSFLRS